MNQQKIGNFLRELRKEKGLTQEQLAEQFGISGRTVSRWETGRNMPDLSILVELSDFYDIDIREIIDGERKSETMNEEMKATLVKVAEYSSEDKKTQLHQMRRLMGYILMGSGIFIIISAFAVFPSESSWGGIYSIIGSIIFVAGVYQELCGIKHKIICTIGSFAAVLALLFVIDYAGVVMCRQPPRFCYEKDYGYEEIVYKTPFYTVTRYHANEENESYKIE